MDKPSPVAAMAPSSVTADSLLVIALIAVTKPSHPTSCCPPPSPPLPGVVGLGFGFLGSVAKNVTLAHSYGSLPFPGFTVPLGVSQPATLLLGPLTPCCSVPSPSSLSATRIRTRRQEHYPYVMKSCTRTRQTTHVKVFARDNGPFSPHLPPLQYNVFPHHPPARSCPPPSFPPLPLVQRGHNRAGWHAGPSGVVLSSASRTGTTLSAS